LDKQFTREVAKQFDELMKEYRIKSSIGEEGLGKNSDEEKEKMVADLKASLKDDMDNFWKMESEFERASVCFPFVHLICAVFRKFQGFSSKTMHKFGEAILDILDGVPDEKPEKSFEAMTRRFLTKEVLQGPLKLWSDLVCFFEALFKY